MNYQTLELLFHLLELIEVIKPIIENRNLFQSLIKSFVINSIVKLLKLTTKALSTQRNTKKEL